MFSFHFHKLDEIIFCGTKHKITQNNYFIKKLQVKKLQMRVYINMHWHIQYNALGFLSHLVSSFQLLPQTQSWAVPLRWPIAELQPEQSDHCPPHCPQHQTGPACPQSAEETSAAPWDTERKSERCIYSVRRMKNVFLSAGLLRLSTSVWMTLLQIPLWALYHCI